MSAGEGAANRYGRVSELRLSAVARDGRTVVPDLYASMPFKVMHPFPVDAAELPGLRTAGAREAAGAEGAGAEEAACPLDGATAAGTPAKAPSPNASSAPAVPAPFAAPVQVMVMSVSAGIMAGDAQRIDVHVGTGAALQVTSQAFEKIHRMDEGGRATRRVRLRVDAGGYLDYRPLPQIPFAGSAFASDTRIELASPTARLVYGEVLSCGRAARQERFAYRSYRNRVEVRVAGAPVFIDNTVYEPAPPVASMQPLPDGGSFLMGASPAGARTDDAPYTGDAPLAGMDMEGFGLYEGFTHLANLVLVNLGITDEAFARVRSYLLEVTGVIGAGASEPAARVGADAVAGGVTRLESGDCLVKLLGMRAQRLQDVMAEVRRLLA